MARYKYQVKGTPWGGLGRVMGSAHSGCEGYEVAMGMSALGTMELWLVQRHVRACAQAPELADD